MKWTKESGKEPPKSPAVQRVIDDARRHGQRLPPGQIVTEKWPVLHYGEVPIRRVAEWRFAMARSWWRSPATFTFVPRAAHLHVDRRYPLRDALESVDNVWEGVGAGVDLLGPRQVRPRGALPAMVHAHGGYTTNIPIEVLCRPETIFAFKHDGQPLSEEHGWPCRLVVPEEHYFWKSAKWVSGLEFMAQDHPPLLGAQRLPHERQSLPRGALRGVDRARIVHAARPCGTRRGSAPCRRPAEPLSCRRGGAHIADLHRLFVRRKKRQHHVAEGLRQPRQERAAQAQPEGVAEERRGDRQDDGQGQRGDEGQERDAGRAPRRRSTAERALFGAARRRPRNATACRMKV